MRLLLPAILLATFGCSAENRLNSHCNSNYRMEISLFNNTSFDCVEVGVLDKVYLVKKREEITITVLLLSAM